MNKHSGFSGLVASASEPVHEFVLLDSDRAPQNWSIDSCQLGIETDRPFSVSLRTLHGGRQEGVRLVDINTGAMTITVVPTRGMNVLRAVAGDVCLGWDSPVDEVVNPAFIEQNARGGLGLLEGFNELVTRCGYEWIGHPGVDNGELLSLHGRISHIPASRVVLSIDAKPPYTIRLRGELKEQAFKKVDFAIISELTTEPGAQSFSLDDCLTNRGDYPKEYQALYHNNFGTPLLEQGARFVAPVKQVSPFNERARGELDEWQSYRGPTEGYDETVYNLIPYGDALGESLAVLHNRAGDCGVAVTFNVGQLPVFSLWKNTDTERQGYVTGLEPGTSFSYNRRLQRPLGLVPTIGPREQRHFQLGFTLLADRTAVKQALRRIEEIQAGRPTEVRETPLVDLSRE
ncbi:aldose 1-epimerase family protein [Pseudomonas putida]|uniref:aldose 1-epimerase family protein n=1 Tax=Pseudomonas putida TaxID=303 RepID=UPI002363904D|nr:aldose 1-epimerase family protein [Pseudomonas putida]MDD2001952.1 aldose 1-epimerase family protein [Pseudomonas putida]